MEIEERKEKLADRESGKEMRCSYFHSYNSPASPIDPSWSMSASRSADSTVSLTCTRKRALQSVCSQT